MPSPSAVSASAGISGSLENGNVDLPGILPRAPIHITIQPDYPTPGQVFSPIAPRPTVSIPHDGLHSPSTSDSTSPMSPRSLSTTSAETSSQPPPNAGRTRKLGSHSMYSYYGMCENQTESMILFEAAKQGLITTVKERLMDKQRREIASGAVYIWDESKAGMKRWTDGISWSNSRVVGPFLEYRQTEPDLSGGGGFQIKPYGLRKRTLCLTWGGREASKMHLIAYYTKYDARAGILPLPSDDPRFADIAEKIDGNAALRLSAMPRPSPCHSEDDHHQKSTSRQQPQNVESNAPEQSVSKLVHQVLPAQMGLPAHMPYAPFGHQPVTPLCSIPGDLQAMAAGGRLPQDIPGPVQMIYQQYGQVCSPQFAGISGFWPPVATPTTPKPATPSSPGQSHTWSPFPQASWDPETARAYQAYQEACQQAYARFQQDYSLWYQQNFQNIQNGLRPGAPAPTAPSLPRQPSATPASPTPQLPQVPIGPPAPALLPINRLSDSSTDKQQQKHVSQEAVTAPRQPSQLPSANAAVPGGPASDPFLTQSNSSIPGSAETSLNREQALQRELEKRLSERMAEPVSPRQDASTRSSTSGSVPVSSLMSSNERTHSAEDSQASEKHAITAHTRAHSQSLDNSGADVHETLETLKVDVPSENMAANIRCSTETVKIERSG